MTGQHSDRDAAVTGMRGVVVVTGTDTGVGKTIVTAAIAAAAGLGGLSVAVFKPAQTGVESGEESDVETMLRLVEPAVARTGVSYPDPLAPWTAARVAGHGPVVLDEIVDEAQRMAAEHDLVLIEGAGGLLVPMGPGSPHGWTVADLAERLGTPAVVVVRAGLGTLNHTALTLEALSARGLDVLGVVLGSWPASPDAVHHSNRQVLGTLRVPLLGAIPGQASELPPADFRAGAAAWLNGAAAWLNGVSA